MRPDCSDHLAPVAALLAALAASVGCQAAAPATGCTPAAAPPIHDKRNSRVVAVGTVTCNPVPGAFEATVELQRREAGDWVRSAASNLTEPPPEPGKAHPYTVSDGCGDGVYRTLVRVSSPQQREHASPVLGVVC